MHASLRLLCFTTIFSYCGDAGVAQSFSPEGVCAAAVAFLSARQTSLQDRSLLISSNLSARDWTWAPPSLLFGASEFSVRSDADWVYLAYFLVRDASDAGAISAKISVLTSTEEKPTNYIDLYRPEIKRGTNRCERRGRASIANRSVRVNQYIDYHDPNVGGVNSDLEDFHFSYPAGDKDCLSTSAVPTLKAFKFDNVERTEGDTFIARNFSFIGTAYAVGHKFSFLRSELHYRTSADLNGTCIGFAIPLGGAPQASLAIHELGFGTYAGVPIRRSWLIHHDRPVAP